jgi:drug/metabolite transporter (DMT)-like permease
MTWLPLALAFPALLTIVNFIDKYIVERAIPDHRAMPVFAGLIGVIVAAIALLLGGDATLPAQDVAILLLGGVLIIIGAVLYFRAIAQEQASQVIILLQIAPVFVLVLAWLLLGESISTQAFIGFWLILAAALGVAAQGGGGKLRLSKTFGLLMLANLQIAISTIILRRLTTEPSFTTLLIYQGIGQGIGSALLYLFSPPYRQGFNRSLAEMPRPALAIIGFNETLFLAARALFNLAVTLGPAALVSVLSGTQAFYAILFGWLLTLTAPNIFRESITRADLLRKVALAVVLFIGLALVVAADAE